MSADLTIAAPAFFASNVANAAAAADRAARRDWSPTRDYLIESFKLK